MNHRDEPNDSAPATVALHSINGVGLGHLARQTALAEYLRAHHRQLTPVILSSSAAVKDICGTIPALALPPRWSPLAELSSDPLWMKVSALADRFSAHALESLRPKVVVHDTNVEPVLMQAANDVGAKQAICLRPRRDLETYLASPTCPLYEMDLVFVPEPPGRHPRTSALLEEAGISALWTGPIFRTPTQDRNTTRAKLGIDSTTPLTVVMSGGGSGADSRHHITNCLAALALVERPRLTVRVILGPLFTSAVPMPESFPHSLTVMSRSRALPNLLSAADLVLCRGGYGSLHEAAVGGAAVLATPAPRDWDNQEARIKQFAAEGTCEWVDSVEPTNFAAQIVRALRAREAMIKVSQMALSPDRLTELGERLVKLAQRDN